MFGTCWTRPADPKEIIVFYSHVIRIVSIITALSWIPSMEFDSPLFHRQLSLRQRQLLYCSAAADFRHGSYA